MPMNVYDSEYQLDHLGGQGHFRDSNKASIGIRLLFAALVVFLFAGLGMGLGVAFRWANPRLYQSDAKIFIEGSQVFATRDQNPTNNDLVTSPEYYVSIIKSNLILVPAIKSGEFEKFEIFTDSQPLQSLREGNALLVENATPNSDSGVIRLTFTGYNPEECRMVLIGVIDSLKQYVRNSNDRQKRSTERPSRLLTDTTDQLKKVTDEIQSLTSSSISEASNRAEEDHNPRTELLLGIKRERVKTQVALTHAKAEKSGSVGELPESDQNQIKKLEEKIAQLRLAESEFEKSIIAGQPRLKQIQEDRLERLKKERDRLESLYNTLLEKLQETDAINTVNRRHVVVLDPPASNPPLVGLNSATCSAIGLILGGLVGIFVATVGLIVSLLLWK